VTLFDLAADAAEPDADEEVVDQIETAGTETEEDVFDSNFDPATLDFRDVVLAPSDWTVQTLLSQMNSGNFELDPDFQRRNAWTDSRKSKFIESLLIGLPIPQIVLAEKETADGDQYIVIDGKQRLLALEAFHSDTKPLRLSQLSVLSDLNGLTREEILEDVDLRRNVSRLDNRTIRTVVIRKWSNDSFLHLVFHRINHQTLALSAQELRQALNPGPFTRFADKYAGASVELHRVLGASQQPDFRMRDVELLVRHTALRYRIDQYGGNLKRFLDDACREFNRDWGADSTLFEQAAADCDAAIVNVEGLFGDRAFRRVTATGWETRFNRAVFDAMTFHFVVPEIVSAALDRGPELVEAYEQLSIGDPTFASALASTTKTVSATVYRLEAWGRVLARTLGLTVRVPTFDPVDRRIQLVDVS
jgi:hypothetical protein